MSVRGNKMTRWRYWMFRLTAILVIPALTLVLLEMGLRILGVGYPSSFTLKGELNGRTSYVHNNKFTWLFFPPRIVPACAITKLSSPG